MFFVVRKLASCPFYVCSSKCIMCFEYMQVSSYTACAKRCVGTRAWKCIIMHVRLQKVHVMFRHSVTFWKRNYLQYTLFSCLIRQFHWYVMIFVTTKPNLGEKWKPKKHAIHSSAMFNSPMFYLKIKFKLMNCCLYYPSLVKNNATYCFISICN